MASVETPADGPLVGLGPDAETRLPAAWLKQRQRAGNGLVIAGVVLVLALFAVLLMPVYAW